MRNPILPSLLFRTSEMMTTLQDKSGVQRSEADAEGHLVLVVGFWDRKGTSGRTARPGFNIKWFWDNQSQHTNPTHPNSLIWFENRGVASRTLDSSPWKLSTVANRILSNMGALTACREAHSLSFNHYKVTFSQGKKDSAETSAILPAAHSRHPPVLSLHPASMH